jgi:hypothetical protein
MIRSLSLATILVTALAVPAMAEEKNKIDPGGSTGPTSTMTDQVPQMKKDAEATKDSGSNPAATLPAAKAVPTTSAAATSTPAQSISLTEQEAKGWIDKPVYSSDGKKLGEVAAFQRGGDNTISEMDADIGGFLGIGETRVKLTPAQFKLQGDRVLLDVTAAQAKDLPKVEK